MLRRCDEGKSENFSASINKNERGAFFFHTLATLAVTWYTGVG
jgi:hypothetical protein